MEETASAAAPPRAAEPKVEKQIKDDPDDAPIVTKSRHLRTPPRRIKEEPEYVKIDLTALPEGEENDMFEDVDADSDEYVDLTYEGIAHVNGVRHFVCEGFKIRQIPEPFIVKRSLIDLFQCVQSKSIILDPDYQREVVWDEGRAALLVTSLLMGYFIPPIIFNVKKSIVKIEGREEEKYTRICVDGKQRLTSIWKFMTGQVGFFDTNSPQRKWFYCHQIIDGRLQISNRNILPNAVKKFFDKQYFCCYEYEDLNMDTEETMFQLVQRGIALTPAEKMRAMSTDWAAFTKQYEDDYALIVNLSKQNRASGFRLVLTIFTMIQEVMAGRRKRSSTSAAPTLQASPQALMRVLDDREPINPALKLKYKAIFDRYEGLIKLSSTQITATRFKVNTNSVFDPAPEYLREQNVGHVRTFSPLELIVTAILVAVHMDQRTDEELLEDVKALRQYLRKHHKDLRVNAQCWTTAWYFITGEMDRRKTFKRVLAYEAEQAAKGLPISRPSIAALTAQAAKALTANLNTSTSSSQGGSDRDSSPLSSAPSSLEDSESDSSEESEPVRTPTRKRTVRKPVQKKRLIQRKKISGRSKALVSKAGAKRPRAGESRAGPAAKRKRRT